MPDEMSKARYYLRCGLTALDNLGPPLREHLAAVYGQWFAEAGSRMPDELQTEWAEVRNRMLAHEARGAYSAFEVSVGMMNEDEARHVVELITAIMVKLGHDDDPGDGYRPVN